MAACSLLYFTCCIYVQWTLQFRTNFNKNPVLLYMNVELMNVSGLYNREISPLSVHVKIFTKCIHLTKGSYDKNESSETVSDHVISVNKGFSKGSAKRFCVICLATYTVGHIKC